MPGRLIMDQQAGIGPQDLKKDRIEAQAGNVSQKSEQTQGQEPVPNGIPEQGQLPVIANGGSVVASAALDRLPTPPPLDQSWRETETYKPMGIMMDRLAQQCFGDMKEALEKMAEAPRAEGVQPNGIVPHTNDNSPGSLHRKRTLMDFANSQRDRFIKALVLSDWARSEEDMARLVDIKVWQDKQSMAQRQAIDRIGYMKHDLTRAKMQNPNIETALELLGTGKTTQFPDLGYLPPRKLTARQLLRTLQNMNVTLAERLTALETLPPNFNEFTISNGRATFRVAHEFEVDLSVAEEDPASPLYFIDMRFLFSPTPNLSEDVLRGFLEQRVNSTLAANGLQGCYDLLHRFVLSHKINILLSQAIKLLREKWFDCLLPEMKHNVFTLQYWKSQPGPKSWIEIGMSTGKRNGRPQRRNPAPELSLRWFRRGQEVVDIPIAVDWQELNMEAILTSVTAKHAAWALDMIKDRLQVLAGKDRKLEVKLNVWSEAPEGCSLELSSSGLRTPLSVQVEHVTGQISITPTSRNAAAAERFLNTSATADPARSLAELLCRMVQERVNMAANLTGWAFVDQSRITNNPNLKAIFGGSVIRHSIFTCSKGWGSEWALCVTFGLVGEQWFVIHLDDKKTVTSARKLPLPEDAICKTNISQAHLRRIESLAEAEVSFSVLSQQLSASGMAYKLERLAPLASASGFGDHNHQGISIYFAPLTGKLSPSKSKHKSLFGASWVQIVHEGLVDRETGLAEVRHELRLTVESSKFEHLQAYLTSKNRHSELAMNGNGGLALKVRTAFGQPFMDQMSSQLQTCERLNHNLGTLKAFKYTCKEISLSKIAWTYDVSTGLEAALISKRKKPGAELRLGPNGTNPHQRMRAVLESLFNKTSSNPFFALNMAMRCTLVFLRTVERLENIDSSLKQPLLTLHVRSAKNFILAYQAPAPACRFDISIHEFSLNGSSKERQIQYRCTPVFGSAGAQLSEPFKSALQTFSRESGPGWTGDQKAGFGAELRGLCQALQRLDGTVRKFVQGRGGAGAKDTENEGVPAAGGDAKTAKEESEKQKTTQKAMSQQKAPPAKTNGARQGPPQSNGNGNVKVKQEVKQEVISIDDD